MPSNILKLNSKLVITEFDTSDNDKNLIEVPTGHGKANRYIIPKSLMSYLLMFDGKIPTTRIIQQYRNDEEQKVNNSKFEKFIREYCIENKILITKDEQAKEATKKKDSSHYLKLKASFIGAKYVNFFSKKLMPLYHFPLIIFLISLSLISTSYYFFTENLSQFSNFLQFGTYDSLVFFLIMALGLFCHELGHTTAAYLKGCRNMDVGAGLYVIFIVFYADLSETWRLKRKERVIIDIGGMYFQTLVIGVLACINIIADSFVIHSSIIALITSLILNLNPFFRMDGYWLAVDYLDTPNLKRVTSTKTAEYFSSLLSKNKRTSTRSKNKDKKINAYIVLSNLFIVTISVLFFNKLSSQLDKTLPSSFVKLLDDLHSDASLLNTLDNIFSLMWQLVITLFLLYFFYKLLKSFGSFAIKQLTRRRKATY